MIPHPKRVQALQEDRKRRLQHNRSNDIRFFNPHYPETNDPDYQMFLNEGLLAGLQMIDAHILARKRVRGKEASKFAPAGDWGEEDDLP